MNKMSEAATKTQLVKMGIEDLEKALTTSENAINNKDIKVDNKDAASTDIMVKVAEQKPKAVPVPVSKPAPKLDKAEKSEFDVFRDYVNAAGLAIDTGKGIYLMSEAWLYLAMLKKVTPFCMTEERCDGNGSLLSVKTICIVKNEAGEEISRSDMIASKNEPFLKDKDDYAVYGMSQTRAIARAMRNLYGYIACGAGFKATPAIEMGMEGIKE